MTLPMPNHKTETVIFDDRGVPISSRFDDPYFSFHDGAQESEYVFLKGNLVTERFTDEFHIGELGFGTGLNFLLTWKAWQDARQDGSLRFTSFEAFPMTQEARKRALAQFPQLQTLADRFIETFDGKSFEADGVFLNIIEGDARLTLPRWGAKADAWYLDGFSPAKNPELWDEALMKSVYEHTSHTGTFATYSAAGFVRRNLEEAGFQVERIKGYGHKRHMTRGMKP